MNYYFMIMIEGLESIVTLANFPPKDNQVPWPKDQIAHVLWSDGETWQFRPLGVLKPGKLKSFRSSELPSSYASSNSPFFCLASEELPQQCQRLPTNHLMGTTPAWRANIQLTSQHTSTSYQGEYPSGMLSVKNGSLLSIGSLIQLESDVHNKFILPNIHSSPEITSCEVIFMHMRSKKIIKTGQVLRNNSTVIDLSDIEGSDADPIVVLSTDIVGIPLFLSHDTEFKYLSFEHTHPPTEMVLLGQRFIYQQKMKKWWFQKMNSAR